MALLCKNLKQCMWCQWHRTHDLQMILAALAAFKENIYQKHVCPRIFLPTTTKNWHRMNYFCAQKLIISRRIRSRIQNGFGPWIRSQGVLIDLKTEGQKSHDTVPLNYLYCLKKSWWCRIGVSSISLVKQYFKCNFVSEKNIIIHKPLRSHSSPLPAVVYQLTY
jgi:hypothetical protein